MEIKRFFLLAMLFCFTALIKLAAQPNGGFENWSTEFSYEEPDEWQTLNPMSLTTPPNPLCAFKAIGSDKHSGNYALKIKSVYMNHNLAPGIIPDTFGCAFKGIITVSPISFKPGYPYTGRPEKLEFWSKYFPVGNDSGRADVILKKWNGTHVDTVASGEIVIAGSPVYSKYEVNLVYRTSELPDSAVIAFFSSDILNARVGSTLFVDDVLFTGWVGISDISKPDKLKIYPNPAKEEITIETGTDGADNVRVISSIGSEIGVYGVDNQSAIIDVREFPGANYFFEIRNDKNKVLGAGKFSVVK